jgi:hypothetical protein
MSQERMDHLSGAWRNIGCTTFGVAFSSHRLIVLPCLHAHGRPDPPLMRTDPGGAHGTGGEDRARKRKQG